MAKATVREILGDDLDTLKAAGLPADKIISIAKTKAKYLRELRTVAKYDQVDENGNIKEKSFDDVPDYIAQKQAHKDDKPKPVKTLDDKDAFKEDLKQNNFLTRGLKSMADEYILLGAAGLNKAGIVGNDTLNTIRSSVKANEEYSDEVNDAKRSPIRQEEVRRLEEQIGTANSIGDKATATARLMLDKITHPGEIDPAAAVAMALDPLNLVAPEAAAIAKSAKLGRAAKAGIGAAAGGAAQGGIAGGQAYLLSKAKGESDEQAKETGLIGGALGAGMGVGLGGIAGAFAKSVKPAIKEKIKAKTTDDVVSEAMKNPTTEDTAGGGQSGGAAPDPKLFDELLDNELMQLDEVESHSAAAKPAIEQISTQAQTPEQINAMVAQYAPPTPKEQAFSLVLNDNKPVSPRFAGVRLRDALMKSIEAPRRTPEELYGVLVSEGVTPEHAAAATEAYKAGDVTVYDNYTTDKLSDIIDTEVIAKTKQLEIKNDDRRAADSKNGKRDAGQQAGGDDAGASAAGAADGADAEQAALPRSERGGDKTVRDAGQDTGKNGQSAGVQSEDAPVGRHKTAGSDGETLSGAPAEPVVQAEDVVYSGSGLEKLHKRIQKLEAEKAAFEEKLKEDPYMYAPYKQEVEKLDAEIEKYKATKLFEELKQHPKYEEHLKNREKVRAKDIRYGQKQVSKGTLTPEGDYIAPAFEKNWHADFDLTKEDVRKLKNGTADEETVQKLRDDLYRYDNDPRYYDHEKKLEEALTSVPENPKFDDIDNWFTEKDPEIGKLIKETKSKTAPKTTDSVVEAPKTKGERKKINRLVEEIIQKPVDQITDADRKILEHYTGKGGLESGTKESLTQHYTDDKTIDAMYKALDDAGFKAKKALEPAAGSGNFLKRRKNLDWETVDIDKTNHEVVKRLYPEAKHHHSGYESYKPKEKFDLIISNVPFSEERGAGRLAHRPDVKALHDHFFVKAMEDVKDNGVVAFITSKGVMDKVDPKIRREITKHADVIGAYRLPDSAFKHTHTNVVTDVIFLQKRPKGVESRMEFANKAFETASKDENGIVLNDYYRKYQDHILGDMKAGVDPMYGKPTYLVTGDADLSKMKINYKPYEVKAKQTASARATMAKSTQKGNKPTITDKKIALLEKIEERLDPKLVEEYRKRFKKHPTADLGLAKHFKEDKERLYELGSYFDKEFQPAEIFYKKARYSGSGKIEVNEKSPLHERLIYNENQKGIIDLSKAKYLKEDLDTILEHGYAYLGDGKVQNEVLYYSGNIYKKIDEAMGITDRDVTAQIETLKEMVPTRKTIEQVAFKGNEPWIMDAGVKLYRLEKKSKWVKLPNNGGEKKVYEWVSEFGETFDNYLNNRKLIRAKDGESETAFKRRLREAESKVKAVLSEIKQRADAQREEIEDAYNRKFNFYRAPDYSKLEYMIADALAELPKDFKLRETQKKFIIKALYEGKGINAHDVGGGKTFAGIVLGRVLKQKGIAKKPLYVVPAKVIKNWQKEIKELYPEAKIVNLGNLNKTTRTKKLFALSNQNADFVLISHEGFKQLKLPSEVEERYAWELLNEHQRNDDLKGRAKAVQEQRISRYLAVLKQQNADKRITLDKLGIDAIVADEARAFKNIGVRSSLARLGLGKPFGIVATPKSVTLQSALAYDFRFKTRYISERNNHSNIYMLDATPTPNKPLELYTMLKHLDNRVFDEYNIHSDEDFVNQFLETGMVQQKNGQFKDGITGLKNVFALRSIMDRFIDRISMQEFKEKGYIKIPESETYRHIIEASDETNLVFDDIRNRLAEAKNDISKRKDVLGIYSNGVTASVDPRLYAKEGIEELAYRTPENNKIDKVVDLAAKVRKKDKKAGQIIFVDNAGHSVPNLKENLHQEIKHRLMKEGYKEDQIAIISGQEVTNPKTGKEIKATGNRLAEMKQEIVNAYNTGKIKVVIGTTKSAGEGMNIQRYTTDIYHLDLPWTPAEITQRNGRGVRYGNEYDKVNIHYFFTQGSFDDLMFNTITKKQGWNDLIWDAEAKSTLKVADSESGGLPGADEIMLAMEKDPVKRKELELKITHERMEKNLSDIEDEVHYQEGRVRATEADIRDLKKRIAIAKREIETGEVNTKEMRDLFMKKDKSAAAKKRYEKRLAEVLDARKKMLESNRNRLKQKEALLEQVKKELQTSRKDLEKATAEMEKFENEHIDERGRYKTGLEEC